jgi:hypothetical protein
VYSSPNILEVIKSERVGESRLASRMRELRNAYKILGGNLERN